MKQCRICKIEKREDEFYQWFKRSGTSGYRSECKTCVLNNNKVYREKYKKILNEKRRIRNGSSSKKICVDPIQRAINERSYKSQKKHPEKQRARGFLSYYIRTGKILRPLKCEKCLKEKRVEAHHCDYGKPLEVLWVCKKCHTEIHWPK
jgi:hypothetical protein